MLYIIISSCKKDVKEFLDKPPGVDLTEDLIFSSKQNLETFIAGMYWNGLYTILPYWDARSKRDALEAGSDDEAETVASWYWTNSWNSGNVSPNNNQDKRWAARWRAIRMVNTLLTRIDEVPDADQQYKDRVKGEAKFIRALNNFEMLKYYGGIPIIDKRLALDNQEQINRSTVEETVNFILKDCDEAAAVLPANFTGAERGHAPKGAALQLKAKTLLFAASPMFNTAAPYLDFGDNNKLISYGSYDKNRWQLAADAAKAVLDWAPSGNCRLITDKGTDKNYKFVWEQPDNAEIILAEKSYRPANFWDFPFNAINPPSMYSGGGSMTVLFNFVRLFEKKDGTPQNWDMAGGNDLSKKYSELDPRFAQTVAYNGSFYTNDYPNVQIYQGGAQAGNCFGGHWLKKWIPDAFNRNTPTTVNGPIFRLAEAYLMYAEALNEAQGPAAAAYDAINAVRNRSGMPNLPVGLSQEQFRDRVRNERAVELSFEEHRFWDLRRWGIAETEGLMKGKMYGLKIYKIDNSSEFRYEPYVHEVRSYSAKENLNPFPQDEVNKGYLTQNPGW